MREHYFFGSLARISDLPVRPFEVAGIERSGWETGDYVVAQVLPSSGPLVRVEVCTGRIVDVAEGDLVVGALGIRRATLETVGDWQSVGPDGRMHALTAAALLGRATGRSHFLSPLMELQYRGHVVRQGEKLTMSDFAGPFPHRDYSRPTILIIGTSMSSGKTTSAQVLIRQLRMLGMQVAGAKLTGAGRYRDILAMQDAGARPIFDFVDAGMPSSVGAPEAYRRALRGLLGAIDAAAPDVVVAEAGASPLEPYNGRVVMEELADRIRFTVLCASDPYAVVGVMQGFGLEPDLVTGVATATPAGVEVVKRLSGVDAMDLFDSSGLPRLRDLLQTALS